MRKVFAATLMLVLSASLLFVCGTLAANHYVKNGTTGQINYYDTKASGVTTATNGNQPNYPLPAISGPPKTDLNNTVSIDCPIQINYPLLPPVISVPPPDLNRTVSSSLPNGTDSTVKNTNGTSVGDRSVAPWQSGPVFTNVSVIPNNVVVAVNQTFSVDVWINNVTDMAGWQITLLWNSSVLKCIQAQVNTPPEWGGVALDLMNKTQSDANNIDPNSAWQFGFGINNNYSATYGRYNKAECMGPYGSGYNNTINGSFAIVTLTFQALQAGSTSLDLWKGAYNSFSNSYKGIEICDGNAQTIAFVDYSAFVEVQD